MSSHIHRNRWHGEIQEYRPKFSDGWQPADQWLDMFLYANSVGSLAAKQAQDRLSREVEEEPAQHYNVSTNNPVFFVVFFSGIVRLDHCFEILECFIIYLYC